MLPSTSEFLKQMNDKRGVGRSKRAVALISEGEEGGRADPQKPPLTSFSSGCVVLEEVSELSNRRPAARRREVRALKLKSLVRAENSYN
jgi:hypothetical protein